MGMELLKGRPLSAGGCGWAWGTANRTPRTSFHGEELGSAAQRNTKQGCCASVGWGADNSGGEAKDSPRAPSQGHEVESAAGALLGVRIPSRTRAPSNTACFARAIPPNGTTKRMPAKRGLWVPASSSRSCWRQKSGSFWGAGATRGTNLLKKVPATATRWRALRRRTEVLERLVVEWHDPDRFYRQFGT